MTVQGINSKNTAYQKLETLKTNRQKRHKSREFIIEGVRNINGAVSNGWRVSSFVYPRDKALSSWAQGLLESVDTDINYAVAGELMDGLSGKESTSELMAVVKMKTPEENKKALSDNPVLLLFDRPSNKGNLGTLMRSCDAFGVEELIITGHSVDIYDPDVIASTMGSFFTLPFTSLSGNMEIDAYISRVRSEHSGLKVIGTTARADICICDIDMKAPIMLLIGNETLGLNRYLLDMCDITAKIPMSASSYASSLNVACAATAMLYEASRQRG